MSNAPRQLSSVDASFLYLETPEMPMHVGSMAIFRLKDGYQGDFFEDFKAMIASRIHIAPILKSRLAKTPLDIDHPSWVEDDQFDIDRHIFRASLPAPHNRAILERTVGWMHAKLLNRARPLVGVLRLRGHGEQRDRPLLEDPPCLHRRRRGRGAHQHDLRSSARCRATCRSPRNRPAPSASRATSPRTSSIPTSSSGASRSAPSSAKDISLPRIGKGDLGAVLFDNAMFQIENAVKFAGNLPEMLKSMSEMASRAANPKSRDSIAGMMSPSTELNKAVSSERSYATVTISLSEAKDIAKKAGGKLNDVVLALSSGVLRRYLLERNALPGRSLTAAVPISLREEGNADANNQVFAMVCSLATQIEDPKERLEAIIGGATQSKELSHPMRALVPQLSNVSMLGAPIVVQILALLYSRSNLSDVLPPAANVTISNVPGPRQTLYGAGAELLHIFPVSIPAHGLALNITVQSYRDQLDFGFIAGANVIPNLRPMADMLPQELAVLAAALRNKGRSRERRQRRCGTGCGLV